MEVSQIFFLFYTFHSMDKNCQNIPVRKKSLTNYLPRIKMTLQFHRKPMRKRSTFSWLSFQRAAGGGIAVGHGKWNGLSRAVLKGCEYGLTATAAVIFAAYMLVYGKRTENVNLSGTADENSSQA